MAGVGQALALPQSQRQPASESAARAQDDGQQLQRRKLRIPTLHGQTAEKEVGLVPIAEIVALRSRPAAGSDRLAMGADFAGQLPEEVLRPSPGRLRIDPAGDGDDHARFEAAPMEGGAVVAAEPAQALNLALQRAARRVGIVELALEGPAGRFLRVVGDRRQLTASVPRGPVAAVGRKDRLQDQLGRPLEGQILVAGQGIHRQAVLLQTTERRNRGAAVLGLLRDPPPVSPPRPLAEHPSGD